MAVEVIEALAYKDVVLSYEWDLIRTIDRPLFHHQTYCAQLPRQRRPTLVAMAETKEGRYKDHQSPLSPLLSQPFIPRSLVRPRRFHFRGASNHDERNCLFAALEVDALLRQSTL